MVSNVSRQKEREADAVPLLSSVTQLHLVEWNSALAASLFLSFFFPFCGQTGVEMPKTTVLTLSFSLSLSESDDDFRHF